MVPVPETPDGFNPRACGETYQTPKLVNNVRLQSPRVRGNPHLR